VSGRYVFDFDESTEGGKELLGGKGAGLAEMTALGIPVPAGFTSDGHPIGIQVAGRSNAETLRAAAWLEQEWKKA